MCAAERSGADLAPDDARALLRAWLEAIDGACARPSCWPHAARRFSHPDLFRRARRAHERKLALAVDDILRASARTARPASAAPRPLFDACVAAIPYAPAAAFLGREKAKLAVARETRAASRWSPTASAGCTASPTRLQEIRHRGVPGFEVEVVSTDAIADRRLSAVAEVEIPFYAG